MKFVAIVAVILVLFVTPNTCKSISGHKRNKVKDMKINHPYYNDPAAPMRSVYGQTVEETSKELNKAIDDAVTEASKNVMSDTEPIENQPIAKSKPEKHSKKKEKHKKTNVKRKLNLDKSKSDDEIYLEEIKSVLPKNESLDNEDTKESDTALFKKKPKHKTLENLINKSNKKLKKNPSNKSNDKKKGADLEETEDTIKKVGEENEEAPTTEEYVNQDPEETGSPEDNAGSEEDEDPGAPEVTPSAAASEEAPEPEPPGDYNPNSEGNAPPAEAPQPPSEAPQTPAEAPQAAPQPSPEDGNQQDLKKLLDESISNLIKANAAVETLLKATDYRDRLLPTLTYPCDTCTLICLPGCEQSCCKTKNQQTIFPPAPTMPVLPPPDPPMVLPFKPQPPVICCDSITLPLSNRACTGHCENQNCINCGNKMFRPF